jgi:hypothetical protein
VRDQTPAAQGTLRPYLLCGVGVFALLLCVYAIAGSFHAEFSGADEAAYVVSGIMVREYLTGPLWHGVSPIAFAQQYYASYPKVAIGHWPPVYFAIQGVWFLVAGVSRQSVLALSALLSTGFALCTVLLCRREGLRWSMAASAGLVTVLVPIHVGALLEIGSDVITGLAIFVATLCCQRWIDQRTARNGVLFAITAAIAILTKGNAFLLAFVAPLALLLVHRRIDWLRSRETWRVAAIVIVLVVPWYYFARGWLHDEIVPGPPRSFSSATEHAALLNTRIVIGLCGFAMLPLALLSLRTAWYKRVPSVAMLPIATWLFLSFASPHTESRLFLPIVPVLVFAAAVAANRLVPRVQELVLLATLAISYMSAQVSEKPVVGFVPAVSFLSALHGPSADRILVASNWSGEGALISEFALQQPAPQRTILRRRDADLGTKRRDTHRSTRHIEGATGSVRARL